MITRRAAHGIILGLLAGPLLPRRADAAPAEPPILRDAVAAGTLPPMAERLPRVPRVVNLRALKREPGAYGGTIRRLVTGQKDIRYMTIDGYARLVGYDQTLALIPDILARCEVEGDRVFTFHLRPGHRWSDGAPFTARDFRHFWEDVLMNRQLRPDGVPVEMVAGGKPPSFEVIDATTVRYSWEVPNPDFLPSLASAQPLELVLPFHYMKQFHPAFADRQKLQREIRRAKVQTWTDLYVKMSRCYRPENPDLPVLTPWRNTTKSPAEQFVFVRNPYFHRIDEAGRQLPYVDRWILNLTSNATMVAKAGAGETDLQMNGLDFADYPFLKAAEKLHPLKVELWKRTQGSILSLIPNLTCTDKVWREVLRDVAVRRALSLAIDRHEINMVSFFGLAHESADTVLPESVLYKPGYASRWATHDPDRANALLDAAGLDRRNGAGIRLLPDGRPMDLVVETASRGDVETDVLQLVRDHWARIGVALFIRATDRDIFRSRIKGGSVVMSAWNGWDNGVPTPDMSPAALAPTADDQLEWSQWGMYYLSNGAQGHAPEWPVARQLLDLYAQWGRTSTFAERRTIWQQMLDIRSEQVLTIGTVNQTLQPILRSSRLRNMPDKALYGYAPTAYLGVYLPDTFWYDTGLSPDSGA
ncbi:ABC transporter substrate-binding protein [Acidimangrovimonas sediminis]|uniref:ABC transporter substrate-binding protein n=1 Tax=Acidimangrovimonas sediminis TaxID=2056283 RepID=UPI000C80EB70|nr:ABC transporter substrate-binding protein [Acidimangrovimonas sediminis]